MGCWPCWGTAQAARITKAAKAPSTLLEALLSRAAGVTPDKAIITYCLRGGLSTHACFKDTAMPVKILLVTVKLNVSDAECRQVVSPLISVVLDAPGLRWKIWLMDAGRSEAGGIYLFDDAASVQAFLAGPIVAAVKSHPALSQMSVKQFDVMEEFTAVTRGPVWEGARV